MKLRWKPAWTSIILLVVILRVGFAIVGAQMVARREPQTLAPGDKYESTLALLNQDDFSRQFINPWFRWDTVWYLNIAAFGYQHGDGSIAFAPLYPWLIRIFSVLLGGRFLFTALLLSTIFTIVALIFLYELFDQNLEIVFALLLFPTSFFLLAAYTESLFLMLVLLTFILIRREKWWGAGIVAGLSVLARFQGVVLSAVLLWSLIAAAVDLKSVSVGMQVKAIYGQFCSRVGTWRFDLKGIKPVWATSLIPFLALALYYLWLQQYGFGSPSAELVRSWGISTVPPWQGFSLFVQRLLTTPHIFIDWIDLMSFLAMLVLAIVGLTYLSPAYSLYIWGSFTVVFTRGTPPHLLDSFSRYLLTLFPLFSLVTLSCNRLLKITLAGLLFVLESFLLMGFFDWRWIA